MGPQAAVASLQLPEILLVDVAVEIEITRRPIDPISIGLRPDIGDVAELHSKPDSGQYSPRVGQELPSPLHQHAQLGRGMSRADMLEDLLPAPRHVLSDLDSRRARGRPHPPNERHTPTLRPVLSA